ncbi:MAG: anti-sigma factor family protein [Dehalococcoidia bacterium]
MGNFYLVKYVRTDRVDGMWFLGRKRGHLAFELLSEYLDGRLEPRQRQRVEEHLATCARCREELEGLRGTVELLRQTPPYALPRSLVFTEAPTRPPAPVPSPLRPVWATGLAASAAALLFTAILSADLAGTFTRQAEPPPAAQPTAPFTVQEEGEFAPAADTSALEITREADTFVVEPSPEVLEEPGVEFRITGPGLQTPPSPPLLVRLGEILAGALALLLGGLTVWMLLRRRSALL